ncbi:hypothetical protein KP509_1Z095400 [Ceratopteris richardii]|nr:hypothetical protein KP509_1Z095400 [Ceratopteris richardii]
MSVWSASSSVWLRSKTVSDVRCLSIDGLIIGKLLGRGGFGKVFAVAKNTDKLEIMACKIFDMNGLSDSNGVRLQTEVANALAEIEMMKYLSSCSLSSIAPIVHLLDVYNASDGRPCAAMELCLGGSLIDLLQEKTLTCREAALVIYKIGIALLFCHENQIVHLDVKPSNILFRHCEDLSSACLSDFGLSYALTQTEPVVFEGSGTEGYLAPELMNGGYLSTGSDLGNVVPRLHGDAPANAASDPSMVAEQSIPCSDNPERRLHRCMFSGIYGCRMILSETSDFHPIHRVHARCMGNVYRLRTTSDYLVRENHVFTIEKHCIHNGTLYEMRNMQPCM